MEAQKLTEHLGVAKVSRAQKHPKVPPDTPPNRAPQELTEEQTYTVFWGELVFLSSTNDLMDTMIMILAKPCPNP